MVQAFELFFIQPAVAFQPPIDLLKRFRAQCIDPALGVRPHFDESGVAQHSKVLRGLRLSHPKPVGNRSHREWFTQQQADDLQPRRFGQSSERFQHRAQVFHNRNIRVKECNAELQPDTITSTQMRTALPLLLIASSLLISACGPSAATDTRADDVAALRAADEQWSATAAKNDLAGTVAFYADDAVVLPPNAPIAKDAKSIRESWAAMLAPNTNLSWKASKAEVAKSGELGYLYGTYEMSMKDPKGAPPVHDTGKFVEVWKKQADGKWKCIVDTYNSDSPVPAASEPKK